MSELRKILQLFLFFTLISAIITDGTGDCFTSKDNFKCRLSAITPYRLIANKYDSELHYPGCAAKKIWMFIRHGTRYPGEKWTSRMMKKLPEIWDLILTSHRLGEGTLSKETIEELKKWKFTFSNDDMRNLATEGERELVGIAERFQSRFPSIMPEIYNNQTYAFRYTATQRTEESAKNFALGLFGRKQSLDVLYPQPLYKDPILRFYKLCKRWQVQIYNNPESHKEKEKFVKSPTVAKLLSAVSKRVGFNLDYDDVHLVYMICAFETAWHQYYNSPWCSLLSLNQFKVIEYAQDLKYYWIDGYGYPLTYEQACNALTNMFDFFESKKEIKTTVYFTHSGAILKLLALLGLAKDEYTLRHDSFRNKGNRAWRTSLIDSFASNIAFILYDCETVGPSILLMHQERVVHLNDCPVDMPCPLSTIRNKFTKCQFDEICAI